MPFLFLSFICFTLRQFGYFEELPNKENQSVFESLSKKLADADHKAVSKQFPSHTLNKSSKQR